MIRMTSVFTAPSRSYQSASAAPVDNQLNGSIALFTSRPSPSATVNVWCEAVSHLWQERLGTIRKGRVTWCVLSPLLVAWAGVCVWELAPGLARVGPHLLWLLFLPPASLHDIWNEPEQRRFTHEMLRPLSPVRANCQSARAGPWSADLPAELSWAAHLSCTGSGSETYHLWVYLLSLHSGFSWSFAGVNKEASIVCVVIQSLLEISIHLIWTHLLQGVFAEPSMLVGVAGTHVCVH